MIHKVSIRNFKCLRDVRITLERFTVFVGPNASGKSSVLQALDLLSQVFASPHQPSPVDVEQWKSRGTTGGVELAAEWEGHAYRYRSSPPVSADTPGWVEPAREVAVNLDSPDWSVWKWSQNTTLPRSVLLRLEASNLIHAHYSGDPTVMAPNGMGVHSALASMALNDPDSWQALQADLRRIIQSIRRLRHTKETPPALLFDTVGGDSLQANQVSEGTLLVLGLLTALYAPDRPNLVLLDDLDRGLHPKAQKDLVTLLRGLLATNQNLQIVATTHSPYLLDWIKPEEVRMTILQEDGTTACAPLAKHPKFNTWKGEMAPGELWSLFGEKWVAEKEFAQ
jgi:predicted ATPase